MRFLALIAAGIALSFPALADTHELAGGANAAKEKASVIPGHEPGIYRFGATFLTLSSYSATACQSACRSNDACFAWSYIDGADSAKARCELKRSGGQIERNPLATSGYSPSKERQRPVSRIAHGSPKKVIKVRKTITPAGTVVSSRPAPLGASPTVTHTLRIENAAPSSPSAKSEVRYGEN